MLNYFSIFFVIKKNLNILAWEYKTGIVTVLITSEYLTLFGVTTFVLTTAWDSNDLKKTDMIGIGIDDPPKYFAIKKKKKKKIS